MFRLQNNNVDLENSFSEKRKNFRFMTFCKAYKDKQIFGFVIDMNKNGLKLLFNKKNNLAVNDNIDIEIQHPNKSKSTPVSVNLNVVWEKPDRTTLLSEIGCQFNNLSAKQKEYISSILK